MAETPISEVLDVLSNAYHELNDDPQMHEDATVLTLDQVRKILSKVLRSNPVLRKISDNQDVGTPPELIAALQFVFGPIYKDLAGSEVNHVVEDWISPEEDSLSFETEWPCWELQWLENELTAAQGYPHWTINGWSYLNPPYGNLKTGDWFARCVGEMEEGRHIIVVIPASVGARWWKKWIEPYAWVIPLGVRPQFVGYNNSNARDIAVCVFSQEWCPSSMFHGLEAETAAWLAEQMGFSPELPWIDTKYLGSWDWKKCYQFMLELTAADE